MRCEQSFIRESNCPQRFVAPKNITERTIPLSPQTFDQARGFGRLCVENRTSDNAGLFFEVRENRPAKNGV